MAVSPASKPYLYGGIFCFLLVLILLISATAVPRFGEYSASVVSDYLSLTTSLTMGAFQICAEASFSGSPSTGSTCVSVPGSCDVTSGGRTLTLPYCGTFNAFRGFLIVALIFAGLALLSSLAHACQASPNPNIAHITFVTALLSTVAAAISLVCWISWGAAVANDPSLGTGGASDGTTTIVGSSSFGNGASFNLLISSLVGIIVGLLIWLYGRVIQQKGGAGSAIGGAPHFHAAPAHYAGDVQLQQPLVQQ